MGEAKTGENTMGDRANIVVTSGDEQVCLYSHWAGSDLPVILKAALIRGEGRHDDFLYLTRIIFCEMIQKHLMETTGFGISQVPHDGGDRIITFDFDKQQISMTCSCELKEFTIKEFCEIEKEFDF